MSLVSQKISSKSDAYIPFVLQRVPSKIITQQGVKYLVTTEIKNHSCLWQVGKLILALAATIFTLGFGLCFKPIKELWTQGFSGKERIEVLTKLENKSEGKDEQDRSKIKHKPSNRDTASKVDQVRNPKSRKNDSRTSVIDTPQSPRPSHPSRPQPVLDSKAASLAPKLEISIQSRNLRGDKIPGLQLAEYHKGFPKISDAKRFGTRDLTIQAMDAHQGPFPPPTLYTSEHSTKETYTQDTQLLGRFDVLQVQARMDFDHEWNKWQGERKPFFVHHGAALNIGETDHAEDYPQYRNAEGSLDVKKYLFDTGRIFYNMINAHRSSGAKELVWFPFGMGAFLRHLGKNDPRFNDPSEILKLRVELAETFVAQVEQHPDVQIHLCLPYEPNEGAESAVNQNYNAFLAAVANASEDVKKRVKVYVNVDATTLAQKLANQHGALKVSLANGANRNLIGNKWFSHGAKGAIDENAHRRSADLAISAKALNNGLNYVPRNQGEDAPEGRAFSELEKRVYGFGGKVVNIEDSIPNIRS